MKVVLLDNIRGVGHVGDIKDVADGYARNFLYPRNLARPATAGAIKDAAALQAKKLQAMTLATTEAEAVAQKLSGTTVTISAKANEQGTLFAGIEASEIADETSKVAGVHISPEQVLLPEHIKDVGSHIVRIELVEGVHVDVTVEVVAA